MVGSDTQLPPPRELNAIACRRCRQKKIRCDREKPDCRRCRQVSTECLYDPRQPRKRAPKPGSPDVDTAQIQNSYLFNIMSRLNALENGSRASANSPTFTQPSEVWSCSASSSQQAQSTPGLGPRTTHVDRDRSETSIKRYRFYTGFIGNELDEKLIILPEVAKSWVQTLYDNQNRIGILLPIMRDFMLTIPSIVNNPYVQVDVRVLILYYGALHQGLLLNPDTETSTKNQYSFILYRKALHLVEEWQNEDQINELSLHVAFWMTFETYSQSDFDLSYKLHRTACDIARALGLLHLDSLDEALGSPTSGRFLQPPATSSQSGHMDTVYRGVHRIYFWQILMMYDNLFRNNLYRRGCIGMGTWKVSLPDLSTWQTFNDGDRDTQVHFEVSLRLARISLKYSELENNVDVQRGEDRVLAWGKSEVMDLVLETVAVLSEWDVERSLINASSMIHGSLYAKLIWDATSMIMSFLRIQPQSDTWPTEKGRELELETARGSIRAAQRLVELDQDGLCWHLGYFKSYITPCIGVIFRNILTTKLQEIAMSDLTLTAWTDAVVSRCTRIRSELSSMRRFLRTLNHVSQQFIREKFCPSSEVKHRQDERSALSEAMRRGVVEDILDVAWQTSESRSPLPGPPTSGFLDDDDLEFLHDRGVDIQQLYDEPCQAILELEKSLLTEPDPHHEWWTFVS